MKIFISPVALRQLAEVEQYNEYIFYVYAVYNPVVNKIYIGQTNNLDLRLKLHNNKYFKDSYTSRYQGRWILIYKEVHQSRKEALIREKQLKSYRGRGFIKQFIKKI